MVERRDGLGVSSCSGKEGWFMSIYHLVVERRDGL